MRADPIDLGCSWGLVLLALAVSLTYAARVLRAGAARHPRVDRAGPSALLGKGVMEMGYWAMQPAARAAVALGATADSVSWASLALAVAAGVSMAAGRFGLGAALSLASSACDALDGMIARETGTASDAGEVLDAAVDRYAELLFFGGVAFHERGDALALVLALGATAGAVMVSYSTAKAEALNVQAPRGAMRRQERAVYMVLGAGLAPIAGEVSAIAGGPAWAARAPLLAALLLVAVVGNVSAARRLRAVARLVPRPGRAYAAAPRAPAEVLAGDAHATAGDAFH